MSKANTKPTDLVATIPHSWSVSKAWPAHVWPHDGKRGAWVARSRRTELVEAGALIRMGHELVILGAPYAKWLQKQAGAVHGYTGNNRALYGDTAA